MDARLPTHTIYRPADLTAGNGRWPVIAGGTGGQDVKITAAYKGDPDIVRYAVTPDDTTAFNTYNAANPGNPQATAGKIFSFNQPWINISGSENEGVDFGLRYVLPKLPFGNVTLNSDWSYLVSSRSVQQPANLPAVETNDLTVNGVSRWRGTSNVTWRRNAWTANLGAYYVGPSQDSGATTTAALFESLGRPNYIAKHFTGGQFVYRYVMASSISYNTSVGYRFSSTTSWLRGTRVRLGVTNLTNQAPLQAFFRAADPNLTLWIPAFFFGLLAQSVVKPFGRACGSLV